MKQINNLIVLNVPKNSEAHEIITNFDSQYCQWQIGKAHGVDKLPPGNYEIIGLCSADRERDRMGITAKLDALKHADRRTAPYDVAWRFMELLDDHNITLTDTTDLLFIKKIK